MDEYEKFVSENIFKFSNDLKYKKRMNLYSYALSCIENKCWAINNNFFIKYNENLIEYTKTRIKTLDSLLKKAYDKNLKLNFDIIEENIFDIAGIKLICPYISNIYTIEKYILQQEHIRLIRRKDYINNPQHSGYRSLHLIVEMIFDISGQEQKVNIEIQIRTMAMDFWATIQHNLAYKNLIEDENINQLLLMSSLQCVELDKKMDYLKYEYQKDFTDEEIERMRHVLYDGKDLCNIALFEILFSSSLSVIELSKLKKDDININECNGIYLDKNNNEHIFYFSEECKKALKSYLDNRIDDNPHLFVGSNPPFKPFTALDMENMFYKLGSKAKVENAYSHRLSRINNK